jgi:hypothetical protein
MGGAVMNRSTTDKTWQQLHNHIEQLLPGFLRGEIRQIEYKPWDMTTLLEGPSDRKREYREVVE